MTVSVTSGDTLSRRRERALRLLALAIPVLIATPCLGDDLIGTLVPPFPDGLSSLTGSCVADTAGGDICAFTIATLDVVEGRPVSVFAGRHVGRKADGTAIWRVTDVLPLPPLRDGDYVEIGGCRQHGVDDVSIVAVVGAQDPEPEIFEDVPWAARLDRASGTLSQIDAAMVTCTNPHPGPPGP